MHLKSSVTASRLVFVTFFALKERASVSVSSVALIGPKALALELLLTPVGELVAGELHKGVPGLRVCVHVAVAADWTDKLKLLWLLL